jgi:hypothetical protein
MARMSIDDKMARDPRVLRLAKALGWSRRETMGCLLDVWSVCYDRVEDTLPEVDIDTAAELDGFTDRMVEVGLGARKRNGLVRVAGAEERLNYLRGQSENGRKGGLKSAEARRVAGKQASSTASTEPQAPPKPSAPVPDSVPDPVPAPVDSEALRALKAKVDHHAPAARTERSARKKPMPDGWAPTPEHEAKATSGGVDLAKERERFTNDAIAKGKTFKNWDAAFSNWLMNAIDWKRPSAQQQLGVKVGRVEPMKPEDYPDGEVTL